MTDRTDPLPVRKRIALIAHDNRKTDLLEWARYNRETLSRHELFGTGTTGGLLATELDLPVHRYRSGPLGGDQQVGARLSEGGIDLVIFFWDPLHTHRLPSIPPPHWKRSDEAWQQMIIHAVTDIHSRRESSTGVRVVGAVVATPAASPRGAGRR